MTMDDWRLQLKEGDFLRCVSSGTIVRVIKARSYLEKELRIVISFSKAPPGWTYWSVHPEHYERVSTDEVNRIMGENPHQLRR